MKYAICYRGISYKENYFNEPGLDSYNVDFFDCIFYNEKYLINPLRDNGNDVDIFFNTYDSKKLNQYIDKLNPIDIRITEFNPQIKKYNFSNVTQIIIDSLTQIKEYQEKNNIKYDYIILNRFDIVIFEDVSKIFFPKNSISVPQRNDDCFIVISGDLLDTALEIYKKNKDKCITHHMVYKFLEQGIRYHGMYPHKSGDEGAYNAPVWRLSRIMFVPDGHNVKEYNIEDVFDENSKFYGFKYSSHTEYTSCDRDEIYGPR
jgi:hypothetical protein